MQWCSWKIDTHDADGVFIVGLYADFDGLIIENYMNGTSSGKTEKTLSLKPTRKLDKKDSRLWLSNHPPTICFRFAFKNFFRKFLVQVENFILRNSSN